MTIKKTVDGDKLVLDLEGRLDTTTAPQLENELKVSLYDIKELTLDMEKLEYLSSAGLRVLLAAQKQMQKVHRPDDCHNNGKHPHTPCGVQVSLLFVFRKGSGIIKFVHRTTSCTPHSLCAAAVI